MASIYLHQRAVVANTARQSNGKGSAQWVQTPEMSNEIKSRSDGTAENRPREQGKLPSSALLRQDSSAGKRGGPTHHPDPQPGGSQDTRGGRGNGLPQPSSAV